MRKILICVVVLLMLFCSAYFIIKGYEIFKVEGTTGIKAKDEEIDSKISELSNLTSTEYSKAESGLKQASTQMITAKTEYENQAALSSSNSSSYASNLETYDIDYLWTKLGNYAKDENVVIKIDVTSGGASSNLYNLNFTVAGSYVGTTDFIYDIENDSKLGFKIDNFKMVADSSDYEVIGSFVCQDIPMKVGNIESSSSNNASTSTSTNTEDAGSAGKETTNNKQKSSSTTGNTNSTTSTNTSTSTTNSTAGMNLSDPNKSNLTSIDEMVR